MYNFRRPDYLKCIRLNHITKKELARVQEKITKELASEKIIQDIYEYNISI